MKKVTQTTLAEALNISRNTVARVMNNHPGVAGSTRKAVLEKAKELGYTLPGDRTEPTLPERSGEVALLGHYNFLRDPFWVDVVRGLERNLSTRGVSLRLVLADSDQIAAGKLPSSLLQAQVDGIAVAGTLPEAYYKPLQELHKPLVTYSLPLSLMNCQPRFDVVSLNNQQTVYEITEHLIERGYRRIVFAGDPTASTEWAERHVGFCLAMQAHGLKPITATALCEEDPVDGIDLSLFNREFSSPSKYPTAYVCAGDEVAFRILTFKKRHPELMGEAAVTGFGNSEPNPEASLELEATADVHAAQIGRMMALQLCNRLDEPSLPFVTLRLSVALQFQKRPK